MKTQMEPVPSPLLWFQCIPSCLVFRKTTGLSSLPQSIHVVHICMPSCFSHVQLFVTPWTVVARLLCPWDSPGKNTGVGSHFLLQRIFPTQGSNLSLLHLLHCRLFITESPGKPSFTFTQPEKRMKFCHLQKTRMELEGIILHEINQRERDKYCMTSPICRIWKNKTN